MQETTSSGLQVLADVERWVGALAERELAERRKIDQLRHVLEQSRGERLDEPNDPFLVIALAGPTAVGKSSLINALARAQISRAGVGATTQAPVIFIHERDDPARLFEYSKVLGELARDANCVVRHRREELLHKVLVDTPDIDSVIEQHHKIVEALLPCVDVILFVTSPERYKVMQGARWIAQSRQQRAMAFLLNKWDAESFGLGWADRHNVDADFRRVLADEGFQYPRVFRVSARTSVTDQTPMQHDENQLADLSGWLESGLSRSIAVAIQERRRRAAWGRLAAVIATAIPEQLGEHPLAMEWSARANSARTAAGFAVRRDAQQLRLAGRSSRPSTPGLLGAFARALDSISAFANMMKNPFQWRWAAAATQDSGTAKQPTAASFALAQSVPQLLGELTTQFARDAVIRSLPLGPVETIWQRETDHLAQRLRYVVAEAEADLVAGHGQSRTRRLAGVMVLYLFESLIALVLLVALWRLGAGFVSGAYAPNELIYNALMIIVILLIIGHLAGNRLFPSFEQQLRHIVIERASQLIDVGWERAGAELTAQIEAADTLKQEGERLLAAIDGFVRALADIRRSDDDVVGSLFGDVLAATKPAIDPVRSTERRVVLE
jgi:hypothetical protein